MDRADHECKRKGDAKGMTTIMVDPDMGVDVSGKDHEDGPFPMHV